MAEGMMSPSDVAVMMDGRGNDGWGNGMGFMWIFALLILANGGWGGFGGNNAAALGYENLATSNEVQRGFDNQNSMANQRDILAAVSNNALQEMQNNNQNTQYLTGQVNDKYNELQRDIAGIAMTQQAAMGQQSQCCCETKMLISEVAANQRYESAMQNNAVLQAIAGLGSKMDQNEINALRDRVNGLELQNAMNGVVRYPMSTAYNAGYNPFCNCGQNWNGCCAA